MTVKKAVRKPAEKPDELARLVAKGMTEKKALRIKLLDMRKVKNAIADYFVVCSGSSDTHLVSIADSVEEEVFKGNGGNPWKREGKENREWILIDYVNVVVHIFKEDRREFYGLENLWGDAVIIDVEE